jgi:hypothetical protein
MGVEMSAIEKIMALALNYRLAGSASRDDHEAALRTALTEEFAKQAVAHQTEQWEWQPIESAPKDGRELLMDTEELGMLVMFWDFYEDREKWSTGLGSDEMTPTHWMKLPRRKDGGLK